jgi:hypothetical protein
MHSKCRFESFKGSYHLGDLGVDWKKILKWIVEKFVKM